MRGGGVETEFREDKQGIGITKRSKKRYTAQQMVMLLGQLAHNVLVWTRRWFAVQAPRLGGYGALRLVRDVLRMSGRIECDPEGRIVSVRLNRAAGA